MPSKSLFNTLSKLANIVIAFEILSLTNNLTNAFSAQTRTPYLKQKKLLRPSTRIEQIQYRTKYDAVANNYFTGKRKIQPSFSFISMSHMGDDMKGNEKIVHTKTSNILNDNDTEEYSRDIRLREEIESPFRKVRFLFYITLLGGAFTSLFVSSVRIFAAVLSDINTDLLQESCINAAIDIAGILILGYSYKQDKKAQELKLQRANKGLQLANLQIRGNPSLFTSSANTTSQYQHQHISKINTVVPLKQLRKGRGIEKHVIIAISSKEKMKKVLLQAQEHQQSLIDCDLVVVPVVTPQLTAPLGIDKDILQLGCIALPAGGKWTSVLTNEMEQAKEQGINVKDEGICIVLTKNGKVGIRTRGINLERMIGDVLEKQSKDKKMRVATI